MLNSRIIVLTFIVAFATACATGPSSPSETQQRRAGLETIVLSVEAGVEDETVEVQLRNDTDRLIGANMCRVSLEQWNEQEETWQPAELSLNQTCEDEDITIGPGGVRSATIWPDDEDGWPQGRLRFAISAEYPLGIAFEEIVSEATELASDPQPSEILEESGDDVEGDVEPERSPDAVEDPVEPDEGDEGDETSESNDAGESSEP